VAKEASAMVMHGMLVLVGTRVLWRRSKQTEEAFKGARKQVSRGASHVARQQSTGGGGANVAQQQSTEEEEQRGSLGAAKRMRQRQGEQQQELVPTVKLIDLPVFQQEQIL
jgi:hypothetical protein